MEAAQLAGCRVPGAGKQAGKSEGLQVRSGLPCRPSGRVVKVREEQTSPLRGAPFRGCAPLASGVSPKLAQSGRACVARIASRLMSGSC